MLKLLTATNIIQAPKTKCGEIYCHSYLDFTIYCTFCDIKLFAYDDFLLHLQNVHFDNNSLKSKLESPSNDSLNIEIENKVEELEACSDISCDVNDIKVDKDGNTSNEEDESIMIIKEKQKGARGHLLKDNLSNLGNASIDGSTTNKRKDNETEFFFCPECTEKFPHKKYLDSHVFDFHNGYKCTLCDKRFRLRHHLRRHIQIHTAKKKFSCTIENCGRSFSDEQYLKRHLEIHTMERTFVCNFENCGKAFQTQRRLITHNYTHRRPKKLVCDSCGYSCRANITLMIHQRVHTGEKPFPCEICQKCFISKTALTEHMITHSKSRPHVCKICNANFANQRILQRHTFIHSDERNFKCKLCDRSFKQANGLDGHMRRMHRAPKIKTTYK